MKNINQDPANNGLLDKPLGEGNFIEPPEPEGVKRLGAVFKRSTQYILDRADKFTLDQSGKEVASYVKDKEIIGVPEPYINILIELYKNDNELQKKVRSIYENQSLPIIPDSSVPKSMKGKVIDLLMKENK